MRLIRRTFGGIALAAAVAAVLDCGAARAEPLKIRLSYIVPVSNWATMLVKKPDLAKHLGNAETNERITLLETRGTVANDLRGALVEIDLLRNGQRPPLGDPAPASTYYALVCRAGQPDSAGFWPINLREALPEIVLPLGAGDPDLPVPLQRFLDGCYDTGRFRRRINYTEPPELPLSEPDATWARELLARHRNPPPSTPGDHP